MRGTKETWNHWLKQFRTVNSLGQTSEIVTLSQLSKFEQEIGFRLPEQYKNFCATFGSCVFFNQLAVYCPSIQISERHLYPLRQSFPDFYEDIAIDIRAKVEDMITGSGLMFANSYLSAKIYIFDLESYSDDDKACDIWLADAAGELSDIYYFCRSFCEFFLRVCIEIEDISDDIFPLPREKEFLRRFHSLKGIY